MGLLKLVAFVIFALGFLTFSVLGDTGHHNGITSLPVVQRIILDEPILNDVVPLSEENAWLSSGDVATFANLRKIKHVSLPVIVNLVFVGFDSDGEAGVKLNTEVLQEWFEHVDHSLRHVIVPVGDDPTTNEQLPHGTPDTNIKYSIRSRIIRISPLVNSILENALLNNIRPESIEDDDAEPHIETSMFDDPTNRFYVDAHKFSALLTELTRALKLNKAYTLFILNPKKPVEKDQIYGYRTGFSHAELDILFQNRNFTVTAPRRNQPSHAYDAEQVLQAEKTDMTTVEDQDIANKTVHVVDFLEQSEAWARSYLSRVFKTGGAGALPLGWSKDRSKCESEEDPMCQFDVAVEDKDVVKLAQKISENGATFEKEYLYEAQNTDHVTEDCLTDVWIGQERFAFIDLTAGPFEWGPVVGGEGLRTTSSVPKLPKIIPKEMAPAHEGHNSHSEESSAEEGRQIARWRILQQRILSSLADDYIAQCGRFAESEECKELSASLAALGKQIGAFHGDEAEDAAQLAEGTPLYDGPLSQLGALIAKTYRHLIARPSPLFRTPFCERVIFTFHLIANHKDYDPLAPTSFDMAEFKHELYKFKLPNQEYIFHIKRYTFETEPRLAVAFKDALRREKLPVFTHDGHLAPHPTMYLDSKTLRSNLDFLIHDEPPRIDSANAVFTAHIPIVMFSVGGNDPVFIDRYFTGRGLSDIALIVQSGPNSWQTRLECNRQTVFANLRSPMKGALAATTLTLHGLIPTHIHYDRSNRRATTDWIWSVGDNPLSYTNTRAKFNGFLIDEAHRNAIITSLQYVINNVNAGVEQLRRIRSVRANSASISFLPLARLYEEYNATRHQIVQIAHYVERLDFHQATSLLRPLEMTSREFVQSVKSTVQMLDMYKCLIDEKEESNQGEGASWSLKSLVFIAFCVDCFLAFVYFTHWLATRTKEKKF